MEREVLLLAMLTGKGLIVAQSRPDYPPGTTRRTSKFGTEQRATCPPVAGFDLTACVRGRARVVATDYIGPVQGKPKGDANEPRPTRLMA